MLSDLERFWVAISGLAIRSDLLSDLIASDPIASDLIARFKVNDPIASNPIASDLERSSLAIRRA